MKHSRSIFIFTLLTLHAIGMLFSAEQRPNILFILVDDLGYADIGVHGCKQYKTPHIDSIFNEGVRFTQGYVANSVCAPSRACLITGQYASAFGFEANLPRLSYQENSTIGLDPKQKTMGDVLQAADYKTICLGKWHLGSNPKLFHPNQRGFDEFYGLIGGSRSYWALPELDKNHSLQKNGHYVQEDPETFYITDDLTDKAIHYIQEQQKTAQPQPFFMYLSYTAPHGPMHAKKEHLKQLTHIKDEQRRIYAGMMLSLDENIGRVLNTLRELEIEEQTMVVFLSDNGGPLKHNGSNNGSLSGKKGTLYEGGIRVPFGIQWKGTIPAGQVSKQMVNSVDLLPTFAAISGADQNISFTSDGTNLMPFVTQQQKMVETREFYWRRNYTDDISLRDGPYKYFKERGQNREHLYHIEKDPNEKNNLVNAMPEKLDRLKSKFEAWEKTLPPPAFDSGWRKRMANQKKNH